MNIRVYRYLPLFLSRQYRRLYLVVLHVQREGEEYRLAHRLLLRVGRLKSGLMDAAMLSDVCGPDRCPIELIIG